MKTQEQSRATEGSACPFCDGVMLLVDSAEVYGRSYGNMYRCSKFPECDTYVGCHKGGTTALGTPANRALRTARMEAHHRFDPVWRGRNNRKEAYGRMEDVLDVPPERAHIAMLTQEECYRLCRAVKAGRF